MLVLVAAALAGKRAEAKTWEEDDMIIVEGKSVSSREVQIIWPYLTVLLGILYLYCQAREPLHVGETPISKRPDESQHLACRNFEKTA